jgi:hypothetical protein
MGRLLFLTLFPALLPDIVATGTFAAVNKAPRTALPAPDFIKIMHTLFDSRRITRAALKAARPARRHVMRALRHHAARTRALASQVREAKPVDSMRAWFHSFFSVLRVRSGTRHFSLRTLLYRPNTPLQAFNAIGTSTGSSAKAARALHSPGHPRRTSASSTGWFAFAMR